MLHTPNLLPTHPAVIIELQNRLLANDCFGGKLSADYKIHGTCGVEGDAFIMH